MPIVTLALLLGQIAGLYQNGESFVLPASQEHGRAGATGTVSDKNLSIEMLERFLLLIQIGEKDHENTKSAKSYGTLQI